MKRFRIVCFLVLMGWCTLTYAQGDNQSLPEGCEQIGEISFRTGSLNSDGRAMHNLDALVPKLIMLGKGKVVRIEGYFAPSNSKDEKVKKSLYLAKEVEQYLRIKHKLGLDLYIAAQDDTVDKGNRQSVRILLYANDFSEIKI
ncbi:hypothetical protein [Geotalea uraniireducens]|uniref:OmpA-like domain-containing protein n=1 Tax=Geotalea uraniireducens (strain Rf4) TaxID=351605 RepID=A5G3G0_GEOUR|nr:hypothetical protein [Geotalea uraniireducens]ABQ26328.1 hypothetical protein Gura_2140 [Geotalea uraniireducens Rf4]